MKTEQNYLEFPLLMSFGDEYKVLSASDKRKVLADFHQSGISGNTYLSRIYKGNLQSYANTLDDPDKFKPVAS